MIDSTNITGIILAGGKSSRMGSEKGFVKYKDLPFISHVVNAMKPLVSSTIIISSNSAYDPFCDLRVEDEIKNAGPLAGLYSGLKHSTTELNLVLSCDVPLIKTEVLSTLLNPELSKFEVVQFGANDETLPLIALYKKSCQTSCKKLLDSGERRLKVAVASFSSFTIHPEPHIEPLLKNINTLKELNELQWS
ncbi:MAG: molybdenum cofactor guanylyltransferase [Bacteroidia bacterium]|nr:molybdenum cofactor guanylyltransferase [Bacteroidia bacterium]RZW56354.1 MAG: molybdenum cofactor guanylyltransferase [Flavobacteriaceae bacterium]